jgi:hypothetical protein
MDFHAAEQGQERRFDFVWREAAKVFCELMASERVREIS